MIFNEGYEVFSFLFKNNGKLRVNAKIEDYSKIRKKVGISVKMYKIGVCRDVL